MPNLPFIMTYIFPILIIALAGWLIELYWKKREPVASKQDSLPLKLKEAKPTKVIAPLKKIAKPSINKPVENMKIVFADLAGAQGIVQSRQIFQGLNLETSADSETLPITLVRCAKVISLGEEGKVKLIETGQALLKEHDADVLIWGQLFSGDSGYSLSFLKNETKGKDVYSRLLCGLEKIDLKSGALSSADALTIITIAMAHGFEVCNAPQKSKVLALTSLYKRLEQGVPPKEEQFERMSREKLWAFAWWSSVWGLQQDDEEQLIKASILWRDLLDNWPQEDSSYDGATARNNLAVVCYFLGENTQEQQWFNRCQKLAIKAQSYFRKTGHPRRWSELEFLVLSVSSLKALKGNHKKQIKSNEAAFAALQQSWVYEDHANFWLRIDIERDKLRKALS